MKYAPDIGVQRVQGGVFISQILAIQIIRSVLTRTGSPLVDLWLGYGSE